MARIDVRPIDPHAFRIPADETEARGAVRALSELSWLEATFGPLGPIAASLRRAAKTMPEEAADSGCYYLACRVGASVEALRSDERFAPVFKELVERDGPDPDAFWHHERVLFVAAQLRAVGVHLAPLPPDGRADADLYGADTRLYIEIKCRSRGSANAPDELVNFVRHHLNVPQVRERDPEAIGVLVLDLGTYDEAHQDAFVEVHRRIVQRVSESPVLHAVVLHALKRGDPSTWLYVAVDCPAKRTELPNDVLVALTYAFQYGYFVSPGLLRPYGVIPDADPPGAPD